MEGKGGLHVMGNAWAHRELGGGMHGIRCMEEVKLLVKEVRG